MPAPVNRFKQALAQGRRQLGFWSVSCSPMVAECIGQSGFDWVLLDTEHSPNELPNVMWQLQAMAGGTATPVVRPAWNDLVLIKRLLDVGAQTLLLPLVNSAAEAEAAVRATRYPPQGVRGVALGGTRATDYGTIRDYAGTAADQICVLVQVETKVAFDDLEKIAAVDGVDGVFIGPNDLAAGLGHLADVGHPVVQKALADAARRLKAIGKPAGILVGGTVEQAMKHFDLGYAFVAAGVDMGLLAQATRALASETRAAMG